MAKSSLGVRPGRRHTAAEMLRELFTRRGPVRAIERLAPSEPQLRAELVGSHLVGLAMARHVLRIEPLASADPETIVAIVSPTIQRYVTGDRPTVTTKPGATT